MQLGKGELLDLLLFVWFVFFYDKPTSLRQGYDLFGPEIKQEPLVRLTIEAVRCHLVRPWIFNHAGVFMWKIISIDDSKDPDGSA